MIAKISSRCKAEPLPGKPRGYCKDSAIHPCAECDAKKCPHAAGCALPLFREQIRTAPVACVTHARMRMYLDTPLIDSVLNREDVGLESTPRRYVLFDENPHLEHTRVAEIFNTADYMLADNTRVYCRIHVHLFRPQVRELNMLMDRLDKVVCEVKEVLGLPPCFFLQDYAA